MERRINVITLGDSGVGKTSIINRFRDGTYKENIELTLGIDICVIKRKFENKNITISLHLRDTAGQEIYQTLPISYIRDSHIVLLVFSNIETLDKIKNRWYNLYKKEANIENSRFILVGNKSDIFGDQRDDIVKQGKQFAEEIDAHFITCSAKSADNLDNLESFMITEAKRYINEEEKMKKYNDNNNQDKKFSIKNQKDDDSKKSKCSC